MIYPEEEKDNNRETVELSPFLWLEFLDLKSRYVMVKRKYYTLFGRKKQESLLEKDKTELSQVSSGLDAISNYCGMYRKPHLNSHISSLKLRLNDFLGKFNELKEK